MRRLAEIGHPRQVLARPSMFDSECEFVIVSSRARATHEILLLRPALLDNSLTVESGSKDQHLDDQQGEDCYCHHNAEGSGIDPADKLVPNRPNFAHKSLSAYVGCC